MRCVPSSRRLPHSLSTRRTLLTNLGMGFPGLALAAMLHRDGWAAECGERWTLQNGEPHFAPRAKSVFWLFLAGGVSHMESFNSNPALNQYARKTMTDTPFGNVLDSPLVEQNLRIFIPDDGNEHIQHELYPLQIGYRKRSRSSIEVSDWFPHVGGIVDDVTVLRSMWTTDNNHSAQLEFHTGPVSVGRVLPHVGGVGTLRPRFTERQPAAVCCAGQPRGKLLRGPGAHGADYLSPEHDSVSLKVDLHNPLPFALPQSNVYRVEQELSNRLLGRLNRLASSHYPEDPVMRARIKLCLRWLRSVCRA